MELMHCCIWSKAPTTWIIFNPRLSALVLGQFIAQLTRKIALNSGKLQGRMRQRGFKLIQDQQVLVQENY